MTRIGRFLIFKKISCRPLLQHGGGNLFRRKLRYGMFVKNSQWFFPFAINRPENLAGAFLFVIFESHLLYSRFKNGKSIPFEKL